MLKMKLLLYENKTELDMNLTYISHIFSDSVKCITICRPMHFVCGKSIFFQQFFFVLKSVTMLNLAGK